MLPPLFALPAMDSNLISPLLPPTAALVTKAIAPDAPELEVPE